MEEGSRNTKVKVQQPQNPDFRKHEMEASLEFVISDSGTKKEFSMRTHSIFLNRAHKQ